MKKAFPLLLIALITFSCNDIKGEKETKVTSDFSLDSIRSIAKEA